MTDRREHVSGVKVAAKRLDRTKHFARRNWLLLVLACVLVVLQGSAIGATVLPGLRAPLLAEPATPSTFRNGMSATSSGGLNTGDAEIVELARGLKYDPGLMYKFVHDHIKFTPMWGEVKGPYMTWMDRSGSSFDQAALMIALLEQAADNNTEYTIADPCFVVGEIQLSASQFTSWFDVPNNAETAERVLARAGLYGSVVEGDNSTILSVNLEHVWVIVDINDVTYQFDPSFKSHSVAYGIWNVSHIIGIGEAWYDDDDFLADATDPNDCLSASLVANLLKAHTAELIDHLKAERSDQDLTDVLSAKRINPVDESALPPTSLPYTVARTPVDDEFDVNNVPDMYRTTLRIQHAGIDKTFFSSDIYGRRLSLQYNGSDQPQLVLDGTVEATGNITDSGQPYDLTFTVDHPYNSGDFDETTTIKVVSGGFYHIVNGWADTGTPILRKQRDLLEEYRYDSEDDTTEPILGQSYALIGTTWLAQTSRVRFIAGSLVDTTLVNHHLVGVAGQTDPNGAPYIDMPLGCMGVTSDTNDTDGRQGVFQATANYASAFQCQVIEQLQDCNAVSTVALFSMALEEETYDDIFSVTENNWASIQSQLYNYSQVEIADVNTYVDAGYTVYVPECGDLTVDDWTGTGFQALHFDASCMAVSYRISGGYSGGAAASNAALSPSTTMDNCYGAEYGRSGDGAYGFGSTDLTIGSGGYPFGLSFSRQYSTRRRLEDGPLGLGWTHSLDIQALVKSDSFQFLGMDSAIDAAAQIVSLFIACDLPSQWSPSVQKDTAASLCASWMIEQIADEVVVIKQGSGTTTFVKDPNDTYHGPSDGSLKLTTYNGNFRLKTSSGIVKDFDSDNDNRISQWKDAHGNIVDFTYANGKLTQVAGKIGGSVTSRFLTLSYDGNYISGISDSASRSVSYSYDANDQLIGFTNLDGNDVTYEYDDDEAGLMTKIYSPIDDVNAVLTVFYDSLGRMVQQVDANDCTWDYYLATYRSEVMGPNQIAPNETVAKRFSTVRWANPEARTTTRTDQMGRQTISEYDGQIRTEAVLYPTGMSTEYTYDENDRVTKVDSLSVAGSGDGTLTTYKTYRSFENAAGYWFVDPNQATDGAGNITKYEYDYDPNYPTDHDVGNLMKITYPPVDAPSDMNRPTVEYTYNSYGQILTKTDAEGMVSKFEYYDPNQGAGLKKTIVDYGTGRLNLTTEYTYDSVGRVVSTKDPRGYTHEKEYYPSGLLKETTGPEACSCQNRSYEYYADGKLKYVKTYLGSSSSSSGNDFSSDPNCVALWSLEDEALTADSIGSNTLTASSSPDANTSDYQEGAASGDTTSGYLYVTDANLDSDFPLKSGDTNKDFTVAFWMKAPWGRTITSGGIIYGKGGAYGVYSFGVGFRESSGAGSGRIVANIGIYGGTNHDIIASSKVIQRDQWYHVAVSYEDKSTYGTVKIRIYDPNDDSVTETVDSSPESINVEGGDVKIGAYRYSTQRYAGLIDELVVFKDILTSTEIDEVREGTYGSSSSPYTSVM